MKPFFFSFFLLICITSNSFSQKAFGYAIPKKITYEILRGTWIAKDSRDLKIFKSPELKFNSIDGNCFLGSAWNFESDSTGSINIPSSKTCPLPQILKFTYQLFESQTGFGPAYKMGIHFENGYVENIYIGDWDGKKKIKMGYKKPGSEVTIVYNFKKKD